MDVLDGLTEEHRQVERLLKELSDSDPGAERDRLIDELNDSLSVHMAVEEQFVYPLVKQKLGKESEKEAEVEHGLARDGISVLYQLASEPGFGAAVDMLEAGIAHHVKEEENEMFPELRQKAESQLAKMDLEQLEQRARTSELSREELYERAQTANIPGRSKMTRDQLVEALHLTST